MYLVVNITWKGVPYKRLSTATNSGNAVLWFATVDKETQATMGGSQQACQETVRQVLQYHPIISPSSILCAGRRKYLS